MQYKYATIAVENIGWYRSAFFSCRVFVTASHVCRFSQLGLNLEELVFDVSAFIINLSTHIKMVPVHVFDHFCLTANLTVRKTLK